MTLARWSQGAVMLVLSVATIACGARSINQVLADPARYRNQSITVRGTVAESASVLGKGAYRIVDQDQGLWVVTQSGAPRKGARVDVKGRLQDAYDLSAFGGLLKLPGSLQSGLVLLEESHRAR